MLEWTTGWVIAQLQIHTKYLHDNKSLESSVAMKYDGTFLAPASQV